MACGLFECSAEVCHVLVAAFQCDLADGDGRIGGEESLGVVHAQLCDVGGGALSGDGLHFSVELCAADIHLAGNRLYVDLVVLHLHRHYFLEFDEEVAIAGLQLCLGCFSLKKLLGELFAQQSTLLEELGDAHVQDVGVERLHEIGVGTSLDACYAVFLGGLCGDDDDGDVVEQVGGAHESAHLQSVGARHHEVGDDEVGHDVACLGDALVAVLGIEHAGVVVLQLFADVVGDVVVVFDDEDARVVAALGVVGTGLGDGGVVVPDEVVGAGEGALLAVPLVDVEELQLLLGVTERQEDGHGGALAAHALAVDGALHGFHDLMDEGESDAGADLLRVAFGLEERFEDVLESLGRYAHAVVADDEAELVVGGAGGLHVDASEAVGELDAVGDEVVENLTHVVGHEVHGDHVLVGGVDELDALLLCIRSEGLHAHADERDDVALLPVGIADGGLDFRDVEQLVDECEQLVALPADDGGVVDQFFACHGGVADDVVGDAEDDGERCAELVGDVGEEPLAAGLQLAHELALTASRPDVDAHAAEEECGDDEECAEQ